MNNFFTNISRMVGAYHESLNDITKPAMCRHLTDRVHPDIINRLCLLPEEYNNHSILVLAVHILLRSPSISVQEPEELVRLLT